MTKEQFDEMYVGKYLVVHCETLELAKEFLALAHNFGYEWRSKDSYLEYNNWDLYEEKTCYQIHNGTYLSLVFFTENNYKIVKYKGAAQKVVQFSPHY